jgi:hypothetical protein
LGEGSVSYAAGRLFRYVAPNCGFPESYRRAGYIPSRRDMFRVMVLFPVEWRRSRVSLLCACIMNNDPHKTLCNTTQTHGTRVGAQIRAMWKNGRAEHSDVQTEKGSSFLSCLLGDRDLWRWLDGG